MHSLPRYQWFLSLSWALAQIFLVAAFLRADERPAPTSHLYTLVLHDGLENRDLEILVQRHGNRWGTAIALTPRWNQSSHDVDLTNLRLHEGTLRGTIEVTLHPNLTWPTPGVIPPLFVTINTDVKGEKLAGRFNTLYDGVTADGRMTGSVRLCEPRQYENSDILLRLERPTPLEPDGWKRPTSIQFACRNGKPFAGRVMVKANSASPGEPLAVDVSQLKITDEAITGEVRFAQRKSTVAIKLLGIVVGEQVGGACEMTIDGECLSRRMRGAIREPAESQPFAAAAASPIPIESGRASPSPDVAKGSEPRDELERVLELTTATLAMVERTAPRPQLAAELQSMESRAHRAGELSATDRRNLYAAIRQLRRRIILSHPALDFESLLINKRSTQLPEHMVEQYLGRHSQVGPGLVILQSWKDNPKAIRLTEGRLPPGALLHPDLSADGKRVLFAFCDHSTTKPKDRWAFFLYEMNLETRTIRQVTGTPADPQAGERGRQTAVIEDLGPCYLPDGGMAFVSTRSQRFGRCNGVRYSPVHALYRGALDGTDLRPISFNESNDWWPHVLDDGRILYTRWDWINRNDVLFQSLWTVRPDGTATAHCYKNNSPSPCLLGEARAVCGSHKIVATAAAHHGQTLGSIVLLDPQKGQDGGEPLTAITPELPFPEAQIPPGTTITRMPLAGELPNSQMPRGPRAGTPYPLSEDLFLVAYPYQAQLAIYLVDTLGGRELIYYDPCIPCMDPIPLRPVPAAPVLPSLARPTSADGKRAMQTGRFCVQDVYQGIHPVERGTIKSVRVNELIGQPARAKTAIGHVNNEIVKRILGTAPVHDDGSVAFEVPAGVPMQFQLLDAQGMALMTMRSQVYLQPGETMACAGCHESRHTTPRFTSKVVAVKAPPLTPPAGPHYEGGFSFARTVQPVLDRYCIHCHGLEKTEKINLLGAMHDAADDPYGPPRKFAVSYDSLMNVPGLVRIAQHNQESYPSRPREYFAHGGRLAKMLLEGHPDKDGKKQVHLDRESFQRIVDWLDVNAQCYGDYSFNRDENREPRTAGETALRAAIARRFGPELARQPYAALVNVALPAESRILKAPLAESAGGWGQIVTNGWTNTAEADYQAMVRLVEASIAPAAFHDIAGTCGRDEGCRCGCCWVRKDREARRSVEK